MARNVLDPVCLERCLDMMVAAVNAENQSMGDNRQAGTDTEASYEELLLVTRLLSLGLLEAVVQVKRR